MCSNASTRTSFVIILIAIGSASFPPSHFGTVIAQDESSDLQEVKELILALDEASGTSERQAIIEQLKKRGSKTLKTLKSPPEGLSRQTRLALEKLKSEIEKSLNRKLTNPSRFTLAGKFTLAAALNEIESQTGIKTTNRVQSQKTKKIELRDVEFWPGIDQLLDLFDAELYRFSKAGKLEITKRNKRPSKKAYVSYSSLARVEATQYFSSRNLNDDSLSFDRLWLDVRWEPRIYPYQLIVDQDSIRVVDGTGELRKVQAKGKIRSTITKNEAFKQFDLRFENIPRATDSIKSIRGNLILKSPVGNQPFRFPKIGETKTKSIRIGEITVTVLSANYSDAKLKIAMQFRLDKPGDSLESHRGWMFRNRAYLLDKKLNKILPNQIMTSLQEKDKMGFVFVFTDTDGSKGYDFVYESPTSIREISLNWQLENIELK